MSEENNKTLDEDIKIDQVDEDTFIATAHKYEKETLEKAVYDYGNKANFKSAEFNEGSGSVNFKIEDIDDLAYNTQTNLNNVLKINNIIRYFVNKNDILGKVYEAIETNINSDWKLSHPNYNEEDRETFKTVDTLIKNFNKKINLNELITETIPMTYLEGNFLLYLRKDMENNNYHVDSYPLGVCEVSDYTEGGEPYLLVNVLELETRLRKIYKKNRKGQFLFYKDADEEIRETFPPEVYKAFKNKERYAKLNIQNSGLMRVNNLKRKYGLSPIFKSLKPVLRLENIELSDDKNTLVRGKKIIFQKLSKELVTTPQKDLPNITWSNAQAKAHVDLMKALSSKGVSVFTGLPWTESISYVENKIEPTNVQVKQSYRDQIMSSIGIGYLSADKGSYGAAQISIGELLKVINRIGEQLEKILTKWYKGLLIDHGIDPDIYCPTVNVIDSEQLDTKLSMELAKMLHTHLNVSLETSMSTLGIDVHSEARKRKQEDELGYNELFTPRQTAFTNNGEPDDESKVGRPTNDGGDKDKQVLDRDYNKENNR